MKLSNIVYGVVGYTLGARAGRDRYDQIARLGRRAAASQPVQGAVTTARSRAGRITAQFGQAVTAKLGGPTPARRGRR